MSIQLRNLPEGAVVNYRGNLDGDLIIDTIEYPTIDGKKSTVGFHYTLDGDLVPNTGHTIDGDWNFPNQLLNFADP